MTTIDSLKENLLLVVVTLFCAIYLFYYFFIGSVSLAKLCNGKTLCDLACIVPDFANAIINRCACPISRVKLFLHCFQG